MEGDGEPVFWAMPAARAFMLRTEPCFTVSALRVSIDYRGRIVMSNSLSQAPWQMSTWLNSLPQNYVGTLYAKIRPPFFPFGLWFKVDGWGQLCDGRAHRDMVHLMLYNKFPFRGRGWTYVAWESEPDNPEMCDAPTRGKVSDPRPYCGTPHQ